MRPFSFLLLALSGTCLAVSDTANDGFFRELELELRDDYLACTGDSARLPLKTIIAWKHGIDSMIGLPWYAAAARAYTKETGGSPAKDRPCAVVLWKLRTDSISAQTARNEGLLRRHEEAVRSESLAVLKEVAVLPRLPCGIAGIPLGVSRRTFAVLAARAGFGQREDKGSYLRCAGVPFGGRSYLGAFRFDSLDRLCAYELEGNSFPADSLDCGAREQAEHLSRTFEKAIGSPPRGIRRIGRRDIAEGKLSIYKLWSDPAWSVVAGLAVHGYRYYAKAVVASRPVLETVRPEGSGQTRYRYGE